MTTAVGVLCARVRVEEKQIITALGDAGAVAMPVPPAGLPLPPVPASRELAALGMHQVQETGSAHVPGVVVDRCANRSVATAMLGVLKHGGVRLIDAGVAATGSRLDVAAAIAAAGLPRPNTLVAFSEATGVDAASAIGFPATLLPVKQGAGSVALLDADTAEAVIEHRVVLGNAEEAVVLVQEGAPAPEEHTRVHVIGGQAVAFDGAAPSTVALELASEAATALDAAYAVVDIARIHGADVVWDVLPIADFRKSTPLGSRTVGEAIASFAMGQQGQSGWEDAHHVIALTA